MESVAFECMPPGSDVSKLVLPAVLDLTGAAELKRAIADALEQGHGMDIDAGEVRRITTPCLQILAAAASGFAKAGRSAMRFVALSPEFRDIVSTLALDESLGIERQDI